MLQINASIERHNNKTWCTFRSKFIHHNNAECVITELDDDFEVTVIRPLLAENNNTAFEDVRLFAYKDALFAFYSYFPKNSIGGWDREFAVGYGVVDLKTAVIRKQGSLRSLSRRFHEKNWVPYVYEDQLFLVTDFDPYLRVISMGNSSTDINPHEIYMSRIQTKPWVYGEIRGGTPLLAGPNKNWYYGFVHSYLPNHDGFDRFYYFTVARYNHENKLVEYHPFPLAYDYEQIDEEHNFLWENILHKSVRVVFPIGMIEHDNGVLVSFGMDDVCSYMKHYTWEYLTSLF